MSYLFFDCSEKEAEILKQRDYVRTLKSLQLREEVKKQERLQRCLDAAQEHKNDR